MITMKNIVKKFNKKSDNVVDNISITINDGEIVGIVGENGAGKTTLMKIACGLILPTSGEVYYDEKSLPTDIRKINKMVSVVLDSGRSLQWRLTVKRNFEYYSSLKNVDKNIFKENMEKYIELFKIESLLDKKVKDLSLGQKQIIAIVSTLINNSNYVFLDEPTNGLDIEAKCRLISVLKNIKENYKVSIIITTHDLEFLLGVSDKCIVIDKGKILKTVNLKEEEFKSSYSYYKSAFYNKVEGGVIIE